MDEDNNNEGLVGIEIEGLDEGDFEVEDVTTQFGDDDPNTFVIDTDNIGEEVMMVNNADLEFDRSDVGLHDHKTEYLKETEIQKMPIKTRYGVIWCDTLCEKCPYISICTKAVDRYISGLAELSQTTTRKARCREGYQLMKHKTTGQLKCVRRRAGTVPRLPKAKAEEEWKSPFSRFFIFKKKESDPPWLQAGYSFGNFVFFSAVILGIAYLTPKVIGIGKHSADFTLDTWKKVKEVKLIGKR